ncbi:hypothetical protein ACT6NV_00955 [Robiginitalea sp. IMCC44478]|uniref:hypothetical protein n=1 Tax=Robiginitalea sp. IMCC44478 TaxID=3459122 RepID=UPI0040421A23
MCNNQLRIILLILPVAFLMACNDKPKEAGPFPVKSKVAHISLDGLSNELHKVVIKETIPTDKYIYLLVTEEDREFWISTGYREVAPGEEYYYREALLKTEFKSKEFGKTFDTIYLVTRLLDEKEMLEVHGN